jgi:hypothetical protein
MTVPPNERPTASELAGQATDDGRGIRCPRCGCQHLPGAQHGVERTIALGQKQSIRRERVCRNPSCGHEFRTMEIVIGTRPLPEKPAA